LSVASDETASEVARRWRDRNALVGSLAARPNGRDAADGVAGEKRRQRRREWQARLRSHALPPGLGAEREAHAAERQDRQQAPAHAPYAV
jgi:hypothetical protein